MTPSANSAEPVIGPATPGRISLGSIRATRCWRNNQHKTFSRRDLRPSYAHGGERRIARSPDERQRNPGPAFKLASRSRISPSLSSGRPLRAGPVGSIRATKEREAERRQTRISNLRTRNLHPSRLRGRTEEGARRASGGTRSPVGVPPRLLLRRPNATAQLRLRASWDAASTGVTRLAPVPVQRAPRRPVIVPAGRIPGAARERSGKSARGDRSRSVFRLASGKASRVERDFPTVAEMVTNVNERGDSSLLRRQQCSPRSPD